MTGALIASIMLLDIGIVDLNPRASSNTLLHETP